jgi:RNA polymerase sigma factor (sigma-70 family)|tara:strand:- start:1814 stop:2347 length:534 start_codon:yes stop_codon:yes gene_type:complete
MTKNQVITDIARYHQEWVMFVVKNSITNSQKRNPEDFVQDAYIKILKHSLFDPVKYYKNDGKINRKYFFRTLKSLIIDDYKKKKIKTISLNTNIDQPEENNTKNQMEVVFNKIEKTISNMYWYDKKMLNLYVYHIPSIRKISTATTISSKSVFKTLKRCKLTIKKEIAKEYYYGKTG